MKKHIQAAQIIVGALALVAASQSFAVDTGASSLNSMHSWVMLWIPAACILGIVAIGAGIFFHLIKFHQVVNPVLGLIIIGSASAIVGFFGLV
ncbi:TrbC/VirB2 family protein [Paraburkholderia sp. SIMBA_049]